MTTKQDPPDGIEEPRAEEPRAEPLPPTGAAFQGVTGRPRRWAPVAVIVVAVGLVAFALLTKGPATTEVVPPAAIVASGTPAASGSAGPAASTGPTSRPRPTPTPGAPNLEPFATPLPTFLPVPARAGTVRLVPDPFLPVHISVVLPEAWQRATDEMVVKQRGEGPAGMSLGVWTVEDVWKFPCRWSGDVVADPALMKTAEGQAEALADYWGQDPRMPPYSNSPLAPASLRPRATTFHGYPARYLETLILQGFDFSQCDAGQLVLWGGTDGHVRYGLGQGELHRIWVVDVNGTVIVIDAATYPETSKADQTELQAMLDSIKIAP